MFFHNLKKYFLILSVNCKYLLLFFVYSYFLLIISKNLYANEINSISSQQDLIIRNQQNFNEFESRQKEQKDIKDDFEEKNNQQILEDLDLTEENIDKKQKCKIVNNLLFSNADILTSQTKENLSKDIIGQCFNNKKISKLIERIIDIYDQNGFITTEVELLQDRLNQGIIELKIFEKNIEEIILNYQKSPPNSLQYRLQKYSAFGFIEGKKLNGNDLSQGLYQLNRLSSNNASYSIVNGKDRFNNKIIVNNHQKFPARLNLNHDNLGNKSTGIYRTSLHGSFDNMLGVNDNINLTYNSNINDDSKNRDIKTYLASLYFPFSYYSLTLEGSNSDFYGKDSLNRNFNGYSKRYSMIINKLFTENLNYRISGKIGFTQKETGSYLEQQKVNNSQRRLTIINSNILATYFVDKNTTIFFKPSIIQGLGILGAYRDYSFNNPHLNFTIFKFYNSIQRNFRMFNLNKPVTLTSEFDSQLANKTLFGSEQISIGGYTTVRGFRERNIAGENGFYWRNKLEFNLGSILNKTSLTPNLHFNKINLEPFIDIGYIKRKINNDSASLSGIGFKTIYHHKYFNSSLTTSWALRQSRLINISTKENKMIYFEISTNCCFF
jgi:hemolysin activation/secretion protein